MQSPSRPPGPSPRRRLLTIAVVTIGVLAAGALVLDGLAGGGGGATGGAVATSTGAAEPEPPVGAAFAPPTEPAASKAGPVLSLPGDFPDDGPGTYRFAGGDRGVLGESGTLYRYRAAVEDGLEEGPDQLAEFLDATLGHARGWTAGGDLRFQRVPEDARHDFTIHLVTSGTAARLCAEAGLDVIGQGLPEGGVSCRTPGRVVLNLSRWRRSVPQFVSGGVPLETYRQMLVNHEVGHELGYGHEACPGDGKPAPVMQQQTLFLDGCRANPWPYRGGARYTGAPVP